MTVGKTDAFIADVERHFEWYATQADLTVAEYYLTAVEATCRLLGRHPQLGPRCGFTHPLKSRRQASFRPSDILDAPGL